MFKLLRIEAVNLRYVISDTEDLSTRRGGSFMLLEAVNDVTEEFKQQLNPISTGASIGLFSVTGDAAKLKSTVEEFLQKSEKSYRHATFTVDVVQDADFRTAVEKALAANRWQQMRHLNFATNWGNSAKSVCPIDEIRPACSQTFLPGENKSTLSQSVADRRGSGRVLRQTVYQRILGNKDFSLDFTDDTQAISTFLSDKYPEVPANLNGKMAVFYADGNSFGKIQQGCDTSEKLLAWDSDIKGKRKALLQDLLAWLQTTDRAKNGKRLRFETLLWGGDEMLFLLPAWLGLAFAQKFFELTGDWAYNGQPLKHAAGLVFAKHSTPISDLQNLAKHLAENGKKDHETKKNNTLSWVVLESFDNTGTQIANYWTRNGIPNTEQKDGNSTTTKTGWDKLLLTEDRLNMLRAIQPLKETLPRSALVRVLRSIAAGKHVEEKTLIERSYASALGSLATPEQANVLTEFWSAFGAEFQCTAVEKEGSAAQQAVPWTALLELWDYILPDVPTQQTQANQAEEAA